MKPAMWSIVGIACVGLGTVSYQWFTPGGTPAIHQSNNIASLERIRGGVDNTFSFVETIVRSRFCFSSMVVPGIPAMYLAHALRRDLEKEFVVVQWDRRGAGKSYREDIGDTLTTEQLVAHTGDLMDVITQVKIPVYFFIGRNDYCDPFTLTEHYFYKIDAPEKHIVWFEDSAHFPFYEEPAAFALHQRTRRLTALGGTSAAISAISPCTPAVGLR
jgi:pimeloyl-ACP methyl ester carboxylesterase